jgi:hypothetical protein
MASIALSNKAPSESVAVDLDCRQTASLFPSGRLEEAIQQNIRFHRHGGNLKSVQAFMDNAIDSTLEKQGIKFIPETGDASSGTHKLTEYLNDYYKSHYDPRGGYGKPLPGRYQTNLKYCLQIGTSMCWSRRKGASSGM